MLAPPVETRTAKATKSGSDVGAQIDELKEQLATLQT
jgi:hypothetical protein